MVEEVVVAVWHAAELAQDELDQAHDLARTTRARARSEGVEQLKDALQLLGTLPFRRVSPGNDSAPS